MTQQKMIEKLQKAGYTVKFNPNGLITISDKTYDETYKTLKAAYNDKIN